MESLNIHFNSEYQLCICRPQGVVDDRSATKLLTFLLALEEVAEPFNRVADMTLATGFSMTNAAVQEYARVRLQNLARLAPFRAAIIAPNPDSEAAARLYARLMEGSKVQVGVFPDTRSAEEWLGVPEGVLGAQTV